MALIPIPEAAVKLNCSQSWLYGMIRGDKGLPKLATQDVNGAQCVDAMDAYNHLKQHGKPSRTKHLIKPDMPGAVAAGEGSKPLASESDDFIKDLRAGDSSALNVTRAAMKLAARRVADAAVTGRIGAGDLDDLKKSLQELRQAETGYIELGKQRGELIERSVAKACAGHLALRLIQVLGTLENSIATQVEIWLSDEALKSLSTEQRGRQVRQWFEQQSHAARDQEADAIESMIKNEVKEQA